MRRANRGSGQHGSVWDIVEDSNTIEIREETPPSNKVTITQGCLPISPKPIKQFPELPMITSNLLNAFDHCKWVRPYGIQEYALPVLFSRSDHVIIHSPSRSGKTIAAVATILGKVKWDCKVTQVIVLAPTCESANTIYEILLRLTTYLGNISVRLAIRKQQMKDKVINDQILVATPEKVREWIDKNILLLNDLQLVVLEDAESMMADQGHLGPISFITSKAPRYVRVMALCSGPRSTETEAFMDQICRSAPIIMENQAESDHSCSVKKFFILYESQEDKLSLFDAVLRRCKGQCLIICERRDDLMNVHEYLGNNGYNSQIVYGKLDVSKRKEILTMFSENKIPILVTTPSFGNIKTKTLSVVINSDVVLTKDKGLDYDAYKKRAELLRGKPNAFNLNLLSDRWRDCARDENGAKLLFYPRDNFIQLLKNLGF